MNTVYEEEANFIDRYIIENFEDMKYSLFYTTIDKYNFMQNMLEKKQKFNVDNLNQDECDDLFNGSLEIFNLPSKHITKERKLKI